MTKLDALKTKNAPFQNRVQVCFTKLATRWRISKVEILANLFSNFGSPGFVHWLPRLIGGSNDGEFIDKEVMNLKFENPSTPRGCFDPFCEKLKYWAGPLVVDFLNYFRKQKMISRVS